MQAPVSTGSQARVLRGLSVFAPFLLLASPPASAQDFDADGLPDHQEIIFGTDESSPDGDLDGYSDAEELARGTDPESATSSPSGAVHGVATSARSDSGTLSLVSLLYAPVGSSNLDFATFMLVGGVEVEVTPANLPPGTIVRFLPTADPSSLLVYIELLLPEWLLTANKTVSFKTEVYDGGPAPLAMAGTYAVDVSGVAVAVNNPPSGGGGESGSSSTYMPLPKVSELPAGYQSDEICTVDLVPVGTSGSAIVYQVVSAQCEEYPDALCMPSDCAAEVGSTLELMEF